MESTAAKSEALNSVQVPSADWRFNDPSRSPWPPVGNAVEAESALTLYMRDAVWGPLRQSKRKKCVGGTDQKLGSGSPEHLIRDLPARGVKIALGDYDGFGLPCWISSAWGQYWTDEGSSVLTGEGWKTVEPTLRGGSSSPSSGFGNQSKTIRLQCISVDKVTRMKRVAHQLQGVARARATDENCGEMEVPVKRSVSGRA